jgi:hypothetical protein
MLIQVLQKHYLYRKVKRKSGLEMDLASLKKEDITDSKIGSSTTFLLAASDTTYRRGFICLCRISPGAKNI